MCFRTESIVTLWLAAFGPIFRLSVPRQSAMLPPLSATLVVMAALASSVPAAEDVPSASDLKTGRALVQALDSQRALTVQAIPLRQLLADLQAQAEICIVLDRRLDPSRRLTLQTGLTPTRQLLQTVTDQIPGAGVSINRSFVYIGPTVAARRLRTLCEINRAAILELRRDFSPAVYERLSARSAWKWEELSRPRDVLVQAGETVNLEITNPTDIPRDLWHAGHLSGMQYSEAATLLLNQFDLMFQINAANATLTITAIPETVVMEQRHRVPRRRRKDVEQQLKNQFADVDVEWDGRGIRAQAAWEQHQKISALISGTDSIDGGTPAESLKTRLFTLTLPDGVTWRSLIRQLNTSGVTIRLEGDLDSELDGTVSVSLNRLAGAEFFPRLFNELPVDVTVLDNEVVLRATRESSE